MKYMDKDLGCDENSDFSQRVTYIVRTMIVTYLLNKMYTRCDLGAASRILDNAYNLS